MREHLLHVFHWIFADDDPAAEDEQGLVERASGDGARGLRPGELRQGGGAQGRAKGRRATRQGAGEGQGHEDRHATGEEDGAQEQQEQETRNEENTKNAFR